METITTTTTTPTRTANVKTSKLILTRYERSVCRVHFLLVGGVISICFTVIGTIIAATRLWHYSLALVASIATLSMLYAAWTLRIRALIIAAILCTAALALKCVALIWLAYERVTIYDTCYLGRRLSRWFWFEDERFRASGSCDHGERWRIEMINLANGIAFIAPAAVLDFVNTISIIYLIYLFRGVNVNVNRRRSPR